MQKDELIERLEELLNDLKEDPTPLEAWIDSKTGLEWQIEESDEMTWDEAMEYAKSLGNSYYVRCVRGGQ